MISIDASKNTILNAAYEGRLEWGVDRLLSRSCVGWGGEDVEG